MFKRIMGILLSLTLSFSLLIGATACTKPGSKADYAFVEEPDEETGDDTGAEENGEEEEGKYEEEEEDDGILALLYDYIAAIKDENITRILDAFDDSALVAIPEYVDSVVNAPIATVIGADEKIEDFREKYSVVSPYLHLFAEQNAECPALLTIEAVLVLSKIDGISSLEDVCDAVDEVVPYEELIDGLYKVIDAQRVVLATLEKCLEIAQSDIDVEAMKDEVSEFFSEALENFDDDYFKAVGTVLMLDVASKADFKDMILSFFTEEKIEYVKALVQTAIESAKEKLEGTLADIEEAIEDAKEKYAEPIADIEEAIDGAKEEFEVYLEDIEAAIEDAKENFVMPSIDIEAIIENAYAKLDELEAFVGELEDIGGYYGLLYECFGDASFVITEDFCNALDKAVEIAPNASLGDLIALVGSLVDSAEEKAMGLIFGE